MMLSESLLAQVKAQIEATLLSAAGAMSNKTFYIDVVQGCITTWSRHIAQTCTVADIRGFIEKAPHNFKGNPNTVEFRLSADGPVLAEDHVFQSSSVKLYAKQPERVPKAKAVAKPTTDKKQKKQQKTTNEDLLVKLPTATDTPESVSWDEGTTLTLKFMDNKSAKNYLKVMLTEWDIDAEKVFTTHEQEKVDKKAADLLKQLAELGISVAPSSSAAAAAAVEEEEERVVKVKVVKKKAAAVEEEEVVKKKKASSSAAAVEKEEVVKKKASASAAVAAATENDDNEEEEGDEVVEEGGGGGGGGGRGRRGGRA